MGLHLTTIKTAQQKPSNVAVYFKAETNGGEAVPGLTADSFRIYEDGQLVSHYESKQTIVNPEVAAIHYTLLLVDMSGSVSQSGSVDTLVQAVGTFTDRVEKQQRVAIYAFDGGPDLYPIAPFTDQAGSAKAGVQALSTFKPKDPSTNLNGAVVKALEELDGALGKASQPLKFGTLVVFTDGTDRAGRVPANEMTSRIKDKPFDVFAIGLGAEISERQLRDIGKSGTAMAADKGAIVKAFDDVGANVEARTKSYYLLSYCSPSRAGKHEVRIEADFKGEGRNEQIGSLKSDFDATGFAPGCDPNTPPSFDVTKGDALAPPDKDKEKDDKEKADKDKKEKEKEKDRKKDEKKDDKKDVKPAAKPAAQVASTPKAAPAPKPAPAPEAAPAPEPAPAPPPPPPKPAHPTPPPQDFNP